jgi:hypothetical protein
MVQDGRVHDIDMDDMDRWCEYIFYRGLYRTAYARISRGSVTDTELQVGQFAVPSYGANTVEDEVPEADRYLRAWREDLPEEHVRPFFSPSLLSFLNYPCVSHTPSPPTFTAPQWFPDAYYGKEDSGGVRGHYYHVFDTVRISCVTSKQIKSQRANWTMGAGPPLSPRLAPIL